MSADSNIVSLFQKEHHEIFAGIGVDYGKSGSRLSVYELRFIEPCMYRALNCIHPNLQRHRAVGSLQ